MHVEKITILICGRENAKNIKILQKGRYKIFAAHDSSFVITYGAQYAAGLALCKKRIVGRPT